MTKKEVRFSLSQMAVAVVVAVAVTALLVLNIINRGDGTGTLLESAFRKPEDLKGLDIDCDTAWYSCNKQFSEGACQLYYANCPKKK